MIKVFQIVISTVVGTAAGCIPIVGYNGGAGRHDWTKGLFRLLVAEACVGAVAPLAVRLFPQQLLTLFGAAIESIYYSPLDVRAFRIYLCMIIPACVNKAVFIYLQSL